MLERESTVEPCLGRFFDLPPFDPRGQLRPGRSVHDWALEIVAARIETHTPGDNPRLPAAYAFFAEFLKHDLTNAAGRPGFSSAGRLNLDTIYGAGPDRDPELFGEWGHQTFEFRLDAAGPPEAPIGIDLPRYQGWICEVPADGLLRCSDGSSFGIDPGATFRLAGIHCLQLEPDGTVRIGSERRLRPTPEHLRAVSSIARIGDPRNDANAILSQLHLTFLQFHNREYRRLVAAGSAPVAAYRLARQRVTWHYQWFVMHDFLPRWVGPELVYDTLQALRQRGSTALGRGAAIPGLQTEFLDAVLCMGPAIHLPSYRTNTRPSSPSLLPPDSPKQDGPLAGRPIDLGCMIDWRLFVDRGGSGATQSTRAIGPSFRGSSVDHPATAILERGLRQRLPSGHAIARSLGVKPLDGEDEPLWLYVLREAQELGRGQTLGPVGGRIAAEALLGVIQRDPTSCLRVDPSWTPADEEPLDSRTGLNEGDGPDDRPRGLPGRIDAASGRR